MRISESKKGNERRGAERLPVLRIMEKYMENEEEPWAGLRRSLCRLVEETRMSRKKTIEEICDMPTLEAWRVTLEQLPKAKLPEHRYEALTSICDQPYLMADDHDEAVQLLTMIRNHFMERMARNIGDPQQNGCIYWLCTVTLGRIEE